MGTIKKIVWAMFLVCLLAPLSEAVAKDYFCYLPGANGLSKYMRDRVGPSMRTRGVPFVVFDPGVAGTVEQRGARFLLQLQALIKHDAEARCHLFGYSMGGVVARWAMSHGVVQGPKERENVRDRVISLTTAASPHFGTPLAKILRRYWNSAAPGVEDLSEENIARFNDPSSPIYSPRLEGIPTYSYCTFINKKEDADRPLVLVGFQLIWQDRVRRHLNPLNDGIVPTDSQAFGNVLGKLNISHGYFQHETGFSVRLEDFLEAHWSFLIKGTKPLIF